MQNLQTEAQRKLKTYIEKVERLESEKKALAADISEIYAEAKNEGFDPKLMRQVVKIRAMSKTEYLETEAVLASYLAAVNWLDTPLGGAAERQEPHLKIVAAE